MFRLTPGPLVDPEIRGNPGVVQGIKWFEVEICISNVGASKYFLHIRTKIKYCCRRRLVSESRLAIESRGNYHAQASGINVPTTHNRNQLQLCQKLNLHIIAKAV